MLSILTTRRARFTARDLLHGTARSFARRLSWSRPSWHSAWRSPSSRLGRARRVAPSHADLLRRSVDHRRDRILDNIKGYLLSIVLAGFTVAGIAVGAAKLSGHSRANDMLFNVGVGIAIFAALPTLVA